MEVEHRHLTDRALFTEFAGYLLRGSAPDLVLIFPLVSEPSWSMRGKLGAGVPLRITVTE